MLRDVDVLSIDVEILIQIQFKNITSDFIDT